MALPLHRTAQSKTKKQRRSRTDQILKLCATGRLGVREAIAETAKKRRKVRVKQRAQLASKELSSVDKTLLSAD